MTFENLDKIFKGYTKVIKFIISACLMVLSILLVILCGEEILHLIKMILSTFREGYDKEFYKEFLKGVLTFFLYLEFVMMIQKYFAEDYHFPLRYFMYIGITATLRLIVVDHESGLETLYFSIAVLVLVIGYVLIRVIPNKKN